MKMESYIDCVMDSFSDLYIRCGFICPIRLLGLTQKWQS